MKPIRRLLAAFAVCALLVASYACEHAQRESPLSSDASVDATTHKLGARAVVAYDQATLSASLTITDAGGTADAPWYSGNATTYGAGMGGFDRFDTVSVDCKITTGTGDASVPLDVYLQKLVSTGPDVWVDYVRFPRQTIGLTTASATYDVASGAVGEPLPVGLGTDDAGGMALDAGLVAYGHPGQSLRLVIVTGAGIIYQPASVACYFASRSTGN